MAAAILTNAEPNNPSRVANNNLYMQHQTTDGPEGTKTFGVGAGQYTWYPTQSTVHQALPSTRVLLSRDLNNDKNADWQDAAIAYRATVKKPLKAEQVANRVVQRIPFNFASQATNPFLKTLDNTKAIYNRTNGLGQWGILKGYTDEGHDSANTDYGGNYNTRAGGLADMNTLLTEGKKINANFGVHVNMQEIYPEAKSFDNQLANLGSPGWDWLDQSYVMDQYHDMYSGKLAARFKQLHEEAPNLNDIYIDVYYGSGVMAKQVSDRGVRRLGRQD